MQHPRSAARDISYANSAQSRTGRAFIRSVENLTGRPKLIKKAKGYTEEVAAGRDFWEVMLERYDVDLTYLRGSLADIPKTGPLIVIANHPFGILDGMVLGYILSKARNDFRILAHRVFHNAKELDEIILPISFDETREAMQLNMATRKNAIEYLQNGGCMGVFPGGTVSTSAKLMGQPLDPQWRNFTAKLVSKTNATVVPIYFDGANSRLFQIASHAHYTLRMAIMIREFKKRIKEGVSLVVGNPLDQDELKSYSDNPTAMMEYLRQATYKLAQTPINPTDLGYEFEERYR